MMQMSTGEGKAKVLDEKETTVYKRALDQEYKLKLKASRSIFSEINKRYPTMPFTVRSLDSKQSRLGLVECLNHGLLHPYPVLHEKVCLNTHGIGYLQTLLPERVQSWQAWTARRAVWRLGNAQMGPLASCIAQEDALQSMRSNAHFCTKQHRCYQSHHS